LRFFIETIGFGLFSGSLISLGAVGFTVQFGISNVLNVAYGAFITLAAYLGYVFVNDLHFNLWVAIPVVAVIVGVLSVAFNRLLPRQLLRRGGSFVAVLVATVWAGITIQYIIVSIASPSTFTYVIGNGTTVNIWDFVFTSTQLIVIGGALVLMVGYHALLTRTQLGQAMRATSVNSVLARSCGIRTDRVVDIAWLISGALCGATGVILAATVSTFDSSIGTTFLIYMIAAAVLGGVGQPYGAMIGGLVVGISTQLAGAYLSPAYEDVAAFVILVVMLLAWPRGLFGSGAAVGRRLTG
jgi:branched-chain amino acid transport system permease protein/neutral amino acid transport system permease protein